MSQGEQSWLISVCPSYFADEGFSQAVGLRAELLVDGGEDEFGVAACVASILRMGQCSPGRREKAGDAIATSLRRRSDGRHPPRAAQGPGRYRIRPADRAPSHGRRLSPAFYFDSVLPCGQRQLELIVRSTGVDETLLVRRLPIPKCL